MPWMKKPQLGRNLKILVLGDYGKGKSYFAASCPEPIYLIDTDRGGIGYAGKQVYVPDFLYDDSLRASQKLQMIETELDKLVQGGGKLRIGDEDVQFRTFVLDSLTTFVRLAMQAALEKRPVAPDSPPIWNVHYPMVKTFADRLFDRLIKLPGIIVCIAHTDYLKDEVTGEIKALPAVTGNLKALVPALFDEVYFADTVQQKSGTQYILRLAPQGFKLARSRLRSLLGDKLPEVIPNSWQAIESAIRSAGYDV